MEHFHSDWTFKPITMLHVNAPIVGAVTLVYAKGGVFLLPAPLVPLIDRVIAAVISKIQFTVSLKDSK